MSDSIDSRETRSQRPQAVRWFRCQMLLLEQRAESWPARFAPIQVLALSRSWFRSADRKEFARRNTHLEQRCGLGVGAPSLESYGTLVIRLARTIGGSKIPRPRVEGNGRCRRNSIPR